jgi:predicted Zn-dependent protease
MKKSLTGEFLKIFVIFNLALIIAACATTGPGGKKDLILISTSDEVKMGKEFAAQVESEEKVLNDPVVTNYVNRIGQAVVSVSDRRNIKYTFKVLENDQVNAFAIPGGFLYIYTGLLKMMENEAQLAGVLAHEVSHVVGRHGIKRLQKVYGLQILLDIALGRKSSATKVVVEGAAVIIMQGHGRGMEFEADDFGTHYTNKAGNNPVGMVQLLEILKSMEKNPPGTIDKILSSHPPTTERIAKVNAKIASFDPGVKTRSYKESEYKSIKDRL